MKWLRQAKQRLPPVAERPGFVAMIAPLLRLVLGRNEMPQIGTCFRPAAKAAFAFGLGLGPAQTADALYDVKPGEVAGKPGSIIRVWPLEGGGARRGRCLPHSLPLDRAQ